MGNVSRYVLRPGSTTADVIRLAEFLRQTHRVPTRLLVRDLRGRQVRKANLVAARDADLVVVDVESRLHPVDLITAGRTVFGDQGFLYRALDDEDLDVIHPSDDWLARTYPSRDLAWILGAEEEPIPWNTKPLYAFPSNPAGCDCTVPINFALFAVARPGERRPCPMCGHVYVTKFDQGQCTECGFGMMFFRTRRDALAWAITPIDAFAFGICPRCRRSHEFTSVVEQCLNCGKLLQAEAIQHQNALLDNREKVRGLVRQHSVVLGHRFKFLTELLAKFIGKRR